MFVREPIRFRTTTASAMLRLGPRERLARLAELCLINADALRSALGYCAANGIGAFRVNSQILPIKTHPTVGYSVEELPESNAIVARFRECGVFAREHDLRLSFHPDQFVVLNSPNPRTLEHSLAEMEYQTEVAEWIGADTINIHGGGAYGDKASALRVLRTTIGAARMARPWKPRPKLRRRHGVIGSRCFTSPAHWKAGTVRSHNGIMITSIRKIFPKNGLAGR